MPTYQKLVRDRIPTIIEQSGKTARVRTLDEGEYVRELRAKLQEEVAEYLEAQNIEELADVMEVLFALGKLHGVSETQLLEARKRKCAERGGFEKRIYLQSVEEPSV